MEGFHCYAKNNTGEMHTLAQRINNYISWSPSYRKVNQLRKNRDL